MGPFLSLWAATLAFAPAGPRALSALPARPFMSGAVHQTTVARRGAPGAELGQGRVASVRTIAMDGDTPDDLVEYSLRMVSFAASAVAGLVFTIFVGPVQAFMRNPRTAAVAGVGVGAVGVLLLLTLYAMTNNEVPLPREAAEQVDFNTFQPPTFQ